MLDAAAPAATTVERPATVAIIVAAASAGFTGSSRKGVLNESSASSCGVSTDGVLSSGVAKVDVTSGMLVEVSGDDPPPVASVVVVEASTTVVVTAGRAEVVVVVVMVVVVEEAVVVVTAGVAMGILPNSILAQPLTENKQFSDGSIASQLKARLIKGSRHTSIT